MVEEVMRGLDWRFCFAVTHRGWDRPRGLLHRYPRRPCDGAGDGGGARNPRCWGFDLGRVRRAAPQRAPARNHRGGDRRPALLGLLPVAPFVWPPARRGALRYSATNRVRAIGSGPGHPPAGDAAALIASEA